MHRENYWSFYSSSLAKFWFLDEVCFISSPAEFYELESPAWFVEASFSGASPLRAVSIDVNSSTLGARRIELGDRTPVGAVVG